MGFSTMNFLFALSQFTLWLTKSAADGQIDASEWTQLGLLIAQHTGLPTTLVLPKMEPTIDPTLDVSTDNPTQTNQDGSTENPNKAPPADRSPKLANVADD